MSILFITGGRRTGTTLLENIVCAYAGTNPALSEAQLITQLMQTLKWASDPEVFNDYIKHTFPQRTELLSYYAGILSAYVEKTREVHGCSSTVVFKNPEYCAVIDELVQVAPTARFLVCVRDPRDQVVSELDVIARREKMWGIAGARNVVALARNYLAYYGRVITLADEYPDRFLFVRYTDMVRDFAGTRARLDAFTGLAGNRFDPAGNWPCNLEQGLEVPDYPTWSPLYGKPLADTSIGRYAQVLSPAEIRHIEEICSEFMARFGYEHAMLPEGAEVGSSVVDAEAARFLAGSRYSTDMTAAELRALLGKTNALRANPACGEEMSGKLEMFRRAARGTLDWVELRQSLQGG